MGKHTEGLLRNRKGEEVMWETLGVVAMVVGAVGMFRLGLDWADRRRRASERRIVRRIVSYLEMTRPRPW